VWWEQPDTWDEYFGALERYKEGPGNGDANCVANYVDPETSLKLGQWLHAQRQLKKRKKNPLEPERVERLERLGVWWSCPPRRRRETAGATATSRASALANAEANLRDAEERERKKAREREKDEEASKQCDEEGTSAGLFGNTADTLRSKFRDFTPSDEHESSEALAAWERQLNDQDRASLHRMREAEQQRLWLRGTYRHHVQDRRWENPDEAMDQTVEDWRDRCDRKGGFLKLVLNGHTREDVKSWVEEVERDIIFENARDRRRYKPAGPRA